ncbi:hypothetical protein ACTMSW_27840 [Micromonospora sp. BQ11]|uniref:hypothetical protein n=1 Tax=Micromonospora sp. BQ11 TaxID=3452212 RepID=UPI003F8C5BC2
MSDGQQHGHRRLVVAAVLAGAGALALVALGWWMRDWEHRTDPARLVDLSWWSGAGVSALGYLGLGKAGLKLGLLAAGGAAGLAVWLRGRRRRGDGGDVGGTPDQPGIPD